MVVLNPKPSQINQTKLQDYANFDASLGGNIEIEKDISISMVEININLRLG